MQQLSLIPDVAPVLPLFVGLLPDSAVRDAIERQRCLWHWPPHDVSFAPKRNFHLTLNPLGLVHVDRVPTLEQALAEVPMQAMQLILHRPERWEVAVLRAKEHEQLRALQQRLARQLARLGFATRSAWTPHVTLARHIGNAVPPDSATTSIPWTVREFVLVWSRSQPVWHHEVLARYGCAPR